MLGTPTRDRRAERREATRREILDAAWSIAREEGLGAITLRDVAGRVGMQAPSLYSYFASKNDIYDAMFGQAWADCLEEMQAQSEQMPADPRAGIKFMAHAWFDFSVKEPARYLLMNQRVIPGFEPSAASYQPSLDSMALGQRLFVQAGVTADYAMDLYTAMIAGLVAQQVANDPGGDRWKRQIDRAMDAYCDAVALPPAANRKSTRSTTRGKR